MHGIILEEEMEEEGSDEEAAEIDEIAERWFVLFMFCIAVLKNFKIYLLF